MNEAVQRSTPVRVTILSIVCVSSKSSPYRCEDLGRLPRLLCQLSAGYGLVSRDARVVEGLCLTHVMP